MKQERLSGLQKQVLRWVCDAFERSGGTVTPPYFEMVQTLAASGVDRSNLTRSVKNLEAKGLISAVRSAGGHAVHLSVTAKGRECLSPAEKIGY